MIEALTCEVPHEVLECVALHGVSVCRRRKRCHFRKDSPTTVCVSVPFASAISIGDAVRQFAFHDVEARVNASLSNGQHEQAEHEHVVVAQFHRNSLILAGQPGFEPGSTERQFVELTAVLLARNFDRFTVFQRVPLIGFDSVFADNSGPYLDNFVIGIALDEEECVARGAHYTALVSGG